MSIKSASQMEDSCGPVVKTLRCQWLCDKILKIDRVNDELYKLLEAMLRSVAEDRVSETAKAWDDVAREFGYANAAAGHADGASFRVAAHTGELMMHRKEQL